MLIQAAVIYMSFVKMLFFSVTKLTNYGDRPRYINTFVLSYRHKPTKLHADVLVWIFLPQFLITICVTHEWENHILNDALKNKKSQAVTLIQRMSGNGIETICYKTSTALHFQLTTDAELPLQIVKADNLKHI